VVWIKDNLDYLLSIPHRADFTCNGRDIHILHHVDDFIKVSNLENYFNRSSALALKYGEREITPEYHRQQMLDAIEQTPGFTSAISTLADGIYIFGHSHIQWSYKIPDREIYLINPGSCGLPLDCIKNTLPYTILSVNDVGEVLIEEQRVPFDMNRYVEKVKQTSQYTEASVWTKVIIKELLNAREHLVFFLKFAEEYANMIGDNIRPFTVDTWEKAYAEWENKGFIC
jgi:predicted phosphodiesterase